MAVLIYRKEDQQPVEVDPQHVMELLRSGKYLVDLNQTFMINSPASGEWKEIKGRDLGGLVNDNAWKVASDAEINEKYYGDRTTAGFAQGVDDALLMGAGQGVLAATGVVSPGELKATADANAISHGVGFAAGTVGSLFMPGPKGAGLVDDVSRPVSGLVNAAKTAEDLAAGVARSQAAQRAASGMDELFTAARKIEAPESLASAVIEAEEAARVVPGMDDLFAAAKATMAPTTENVAVAKAAQAVPPPAAPQTLVDDAFKLAEEGATPGVDVAETAARVVDSDWYKTAYAATGLPRLYAQMGLDLAGGVESAVIAAATKAGLKDSSTLLRAVARIGGLATGGAAEGAAMSIAQGLREEAFGDPNVSGQALVSNLMDGALAGGVGGAVFGGLGQLFRPLKRFVVNKGVAVMDAEAASQQFAPFDQIADAVGITPQRLGNIAKEYGSGLANFEKEIQRIAKDELLALDGKGSLFNPKLQPGENVRRVAATRNTYGEITEGIREGLDKTLQDAKIHIAALSKTDLDSLVANLKRSVVGPEATGPVSTEAADWLTKKIKELGAEGQGLSFSDAQKLSRSIGELQYAKDDALREAGHYLRGQFLEKMDASMKLAFEAIKTNGLDKQLIKDLAVSTTTRAKALEGLQNAAQVQQLYDRAKTTYWSIFRIAKAVSGNMYMTRSLVNWDSVIRGLSNVAAWNIGAGASLASLPLKLGRRGAVMAAASMVEGSFKRGMLAHGSALETLGGLRGHLVAEQARLLDAALVSRKMGERTARRLLPTIEFFRKLTGTDSSTEGIEKLREEIERAKKDPMSFADTISAETAPYAQHASATATAVTAMRARQFAAADRELPQTKDEFQPDQKKPINPQQAAVAMGKIRAIFDPYWVLQMAIAGRASQEHIDLAKEVAPEYMQRAIQQLVLSVQTQEKKASYRQREILGKLAGLDLTQSSTPGFKSRAKEAYMAVSEATQGAPGNIRLPAPDTLNLQGMWTSEATRLAKI